MRAIMVQTFWVCDPEFPQVQFNVTESELEEMLAKEDKSSWWYIRYNGILNTWRDSEEAFDRPTRSLSTRAP